MSAVTETPPVDSPAPSDDPAPASGRSPRNGRRSTRWFAVWTVVALVALSALAIEGVRTARSMRGGATTEVISDPDAPGFIATVDPTPVHLVALTTANDELSCVMVLVPATRGGTMVWTLGELVMDVDGQPKSLAELYGTGGMDAAKAELERALSFGVTDVTILGPDQLAEIAGPVLPLTVDNPDRVRIDAGGRRTERFPSGEISLDDKDLFDFVTVKGAGEAPENRSTRVDVAFGALTSALGDTERSSSTVTTDAGVDLAEVLAGLGRGQLDFVVLPSVRQSFSTSYMYRPDPDAIATSLAGVVQFPVSAFPGQRPRVRVLNGTRETGAAQAVAPQLAAAGSEVVVIGNADSFDAARTTVVYSDPAFDEVAQRIAEGLGVQPQRLDEVSDAADIDVVLGPDQNT